MNMKAMHASPTRAVVLLLLALFFTANLHAQARKDTLYTRDNQAVGVNIDDIRQDAINHSYKATFKSWIELNNKELNQINLSFVREIVFKDGFRVPIENGAPVLNDVLQAPTKVGRFGKIYAEGIFPLTEDQSRTYLGAPVYECVFIPARKTFTLSAWQGGVGLAMVLGGMLGDDTFTEWEDVKDGEKKVGYIEYGYRNPYTTGLKAFGVGTLISAGANMISSALFVRYIGSHAEQINLPSIGRSKFRVACGLSLTGAGLALAGYGIARMNDGKHWKQEWRLNPDRLHDDLILQEGNKPGNEWLWVAAGALVANLGVCQFTYGFNSLKGHHRLKQAGLDQLSLHYGATPDGFGLCLVF